MRQSDFYTPSEIRMDRTAYFTLGFVLGIGATVGAAFLAMWVTNII